MPAPAHVVRPSPQPTALVGKKIAPIWVDSDGPMMESLDIIAKFDPEGFFKPASGRTDLKVRAWAGGWAMRSGRPVRMYMGDRGTEKQRKDGRDRGDSDGIGGGDGGGGGGGVGVFARGQVDGIMLWLCGCHCFCGPRTRWRQSVRFIGSGWLQDLAQATPAPLAGVAKVRPDVDAEAPAPTLRQGAGRLR